MDFILVDEEAEDQLGPEVTDVTPSPAVVSLDEENGKEKDKQEMDKKEEEEKDVEASCWPF